MIGGRKFRTEQGRRRERVRLSIRYTLLAFGTGILLALIVYGLHRPQVRIQEIHVEHEEILGSGAIQDTVHAVLSGTYGYVVPRNSVVVVSPARLEREILATYPKLKTVSVQRVGLNTLKISLSERATRALWCGDVVPPVAYEHAMEVEAGREEVWGNCFLADEQGFLFDRAPVYTGNVYPRYYGSLVHAEPVGQGLAEPTEFARWQELFSTLHEQERELKALLFVDERDVELYVSGGLRVLTLRQEDTNTVAKRLITTLNALSDEKLGRVEYIDMRFGNKVYVKYVDTSAPTTAIEPTEPIETIPPSPPSESSQPGVASSTDERDE